MKKADLIKTAVEIPVLKVPEAKEDPSWSSPPAPEGWDDAEETRELEVFDESKACGCSQLWFCAGHLREIRIAANTFPGVPRG